MKTDNKKLLADTNIILYLYSGNEDVRELLRGYEIFISVKTELEILRYQGLTKAEFQSIKESFRELKIIEINNQIKELVYKISHDKKIKLTDCIIAASAIYLNIPLVTADREFDKLPHAQTILVNI